MNTNFAKLLVLVLLSLHSVTSTAAEFSAKIIDGLGRPVLDAVVDVYWFGPESEKLARRVELVRVRTNQHGIAKGTYDEKSIPAGEMIYVAVSKDGYGSYSMATLQADYVLKREFGPSDLRRIVKLSGEAQLKEMRELLAGNFKFKTFDEHLRELVFFHEQQLRPVLKALVQDPKVGTAAAQLLAYIGVPEDIRLVVRHAPAPKRCGFEDRWAYYVVCALLDPKTEEEWVFLRSCALNEYDDRWVDAGAIETLRLIASPRSLRILKEVREKNTYRERFIAKAVEYIESNPPSLSDKKLTEAGEKVAQAIKIGNWQGNKKPRFNQKGDMALIECEFIADRDVLIYTATFHKVGSVWKLRGVRETFQAFLGRPPEKEKSGKKE